MRQEVPSDSTFALRRWSAWWLGCGMSLLGGCQHLAPPQSYPGSSMIGSHGRWSQPSASPTRTQLVSTTAPQSGTTRAKPQTDLSPSPAAGVGTSPMTIRGQSPTNRYNGPGAYQLPVPQQQVDPNALPNLQTSPPAGQPVYGQPTYGQPTYGQPAPPATVGVLPPSTVPLQAGVAGPPPAYPQAAGVGVLPPGTMAPTSPSDYGATLAPGAMQAPPSTAGTLAPGAVPYIDPNLGITAPTDVAYAPRERVAPLDVYVQEARTGRIILGGSVNSDLGVAGQLIIDERNFNIRRLPRSWGDLWNGRAFRGGGQNFRAELMPGNRVERYTVSWTERNLFGYLPYSLSVGGFLYTRQFRDWTEQRLGGRVALGYEVTQDISFSGELRMEDVKLFDPRVAGVDQLDSALGSNDIYTARFRVAKDTRDSPFMSTEGALLELVFDQVFGEYDYSRGAVNYSRYFQLRERPDGTGRHVLATTWKLGVTGSQTPIFENYFAGGYSTLRGFSFRGASPVENDVQVGGELMMLGSLEYVFPLTADDMLRGVAFVDCGTVEQDIEINSENFRVAPGLGVRVTVPALGPAPLAFDFAYPINNADTDDRQVFSFFMGFTR